MRLMYLAVLLADLGVVAVVPHNFGGYFGVIIMAFMLYWEK